MSRATIFIDNGVTGSIGWVSDDGLSGFELTPVIKTQNYTKKKDQISRVDVGRMRGLLASLFLTYEGNVEAVLERPLVNPQMFKATISAVRCMEATMTVLESLEIGYSFCDSRDWQKHMLPEGVKGTPELKKASMDKGIQLYPQFADLIRKHKDADGILGARYFFDNHIRY